MSEGNPTFFNFAGHYINFGQKKAGETLKATGFRLSGQLARGIQQNAIAQGQNAEWYSIVQYLIYQVADTWGLGVRGEWFRDHNGVRYLAGSANYYAMTAGVNWKPNSWLMVRPELRYDWSEAQIAPFDGGQRTDQLLLGADAVIQF